MEVTSYIEKLNDLLWLYGPKVLSAVLLLFIGLWLIRKLSEGFDVFLRSRKVDESLRSFFETLINTGMKVVLLIMVASTIGIQTTSFIAIISAIAFAVGLALQGSLGNFASGVLILLFKPYKVGDFITVDGKSGNVSEIQIFNTVLTTEHGKKIVIPNSKMTDSAIENVAEGKEVQVEISLLLSNTTSLDELRQAAQEVAKTNQYGIPNKEAEVQVSGITRDEMKVQFACWTLGQHYEQTEDHMYEDLRRVFLERNIELAKERNIVVG